MPTRPDFYDFFVTEINKLLVSPVKYSKTSNYFLFRSNSKIYKVSQKQISPENSSIEVHIARRKNQILTNHSPELDSELFVLSRNKDGEYVLEPIDQSFNIPERFVYSMFYFNPSSCLDHIIEKNKITDEHLNQLADFFTRFHESAEKSSEKTANSPEKLNELIDDLLYQSKKNLGKTINQSIINIVEAPLKKFVHAHKKILNKRVRSEFIREIHGCVIPKKIFMTKTGISILMHNKQKFHDFRDIFIDIAELCLEFRNLERIDLSEKIAHIYLSRQNAVTEEEGKKLIYFYEVIKAMEWGAHFSFSDKKDPEKDRRDAISYYQKAASLISNLR